MAGTGAGVLGFLAFAVGGEIEVDAKITVLGVGDGADLYDDAIGCSVRQGGFRIIASG